jgi:hypothetical protein
MPLSLGDVLNTLSDPAALGIDFYVAKIHIKGEYLSTVRDHILAGNIQVTGGDSDLAKYDQMTDVLYTQKKSPPANDGDRALLLHECVHAMIDVYYPDGDVTRHMGELAAYLTQTAYSVRKDPTSNRNGTQPWDKFWGDLYTTIRSNKLDTAAGNGARIAPDTLENLRQQLAKLPSVNYGNFSKEATGVSNGLKNPFLYPTVTEQPSTRYSNVSYETYPDLTDEYLIQTLTEHYALTDVRGYGSRLRQLRRDFLRCSKSRAQELRSRLLAPRGADRVSELFYERLSHGGRAILLRVLSLRLA